MWIGRDKDGELWLFTHKPMRCTAPGWNNEFWDSPDLVDDDNDIVSAMTINPNLYPEVTWENEPIEVDLVVSRKQKL